MKSAVLSFILCLASGASWADSPECFPADRPDCDVGIIYLHGLIPPKGTNPLESSNRRYLRNLVTRLNQQAGKRGARCIRVAFPISPLIRKTKFGTNRGWSRPSYARGAAQIEATALAGARRACEGSFLAKNIMLSGYSNGANAVAEMEQDLSCSELHRFNVMTAIGPDGQDVRTRTKLSNPKNPNSKCNKFLVNNYHQVGLPGSSDMFVSDNTNFLVTPPGVPEQTAEAKPVVDDDATD